jgi:hypothetical protein
MAALDIAIVHVALPSIQRDLGIGQSTLQWIVQALRCCQPDEPNGIGTVMTWALAQAVPRAACQMVSWVPWTARAFHSPDGLGASVAVPGGSTGSCRQESVELVMTAARRWVRVIARLPASPDDADVKVAPFSGSGGDSFQCAPPSADQPARRRSARPVPAPSSAVVVCPVVMSLRTVMAWWA